MQSLYAEASRRCQSRLVVREESCEPSQGFQLSPGRDTIRRKEMNHARVSSSSHYKRK